MPLLELSYRPAWPFRFGHASTIWPSAMRRIHGFEWTVRERLETPDGDFVDLDGRPDGRSRAIVICHGLEGHSRRAYVLGLARAFERAGFDPWALNFRGCSGESNRTCGAYHSGLSDDLHLAVAHLAGRYRTVVAAGFSLGANVVLKYLGEPRDDRPRQLHSGIAFSAPCDLASSAIELNKPKNWLYRERFLRTLKKKLRLKAACFPGLPDARTIHRLRTLDQFDDLYTAPVHGFADAADYYRRASSRQFLMGIDRPTLMLSAQDDPILAPECFPWAEAKLQPFLHLCTPLYGGHTGFYLPGDLYWSERLAVEFVMEQRRATR